MISYRHHIGGGGEIYDAAAIFLFYILLSFNLDESCVQALPDSCN